MCISSKNALILFGSPRPSGYSALLANELIAELRPHYSISELRAYELNLMPCIACGHCRQADHHCALTDSRWLYELIDQASVIAIASPIYNFGVPAPLKAIFDRTQCYYQGFKAHGKTIVQRPKRGILLLSAGSCDVTSSSQLSRQISLILRPLNCSLDDTITLYNTDCTPEITTAIKATRVAGRKLAL